MRLTVTVIYQSENHPTAQPHCGQDTRGHTGSAVVMRSVSWLGMNYDTLIYLRGYIPMTANAALSKCTPRVVGSVLC